MKIKFKKQVQGGRYQVDFEIGDYSDEDKAFFQDETSLPLELTLNFAYDPEGNSLYVLKTELNPQVPSSGTLCFKRKDDAERFIKDLSERVKEVFERHKEELKRKQEEFSGELEVEL